MKFLTFFLACVTLAGLARGEGQEPTEPDTLVGLSEKKTIVLGNNSLTIRFGGVDAASYAKVVPCYGLQFTARAARGGAEPIDYTFGNNENNFVLGFQASSVYPTLTFKSTTPGADYTPYEGMAEVYSYQNENEYQLLCPTITVNDPTFKINMKKNSDDNSAVVSWTSVKETEGITYTIYRKDFKKGSEQAVPEGVFETVCGAKLTFTETSIRPTCTGGKCSCKVDNLDVNKVTSVMIAATKDSTGCSVAYSRVNLNDNGAGQLSCFMALVLFFAFYLFF